MSVTKIEQIETMILDIPTIRGHVLSMATMRTQSAVLVFIRFSDGSEGIGEGTTIGGLTYGPESPESIQSAIDTYIAPALVGRNADDVNGSLQLMDKMVRGNRIAKTAVEIALWDGLGKRLGVPVSQLFGGAVTNKMPVAWTLASGNSDTDVAEALEMIETRRHNIFKLKIGKRMVRDDVAHVARIKQAVSAASRRQRAWHKKACARSWLSKRHSLVKSVQASRLAPTPSIALIIWGSESICAARRSMLMLSA